MSFRRSELSPARMARVPVDSTRTGVREFKSVSSRTRAERAPTDRTRPTRPSPVTTGEPDVATLGDAFSTYWNLCAKPRTGIDPYTGKAYPDKQGTLRDELTFLRAWSHQYYLWYN